MQEYNTFYFTALELQYVMCNNSEKHANVFLQSHF